MGKSNHNRDDTTGRDAKQDRSNKRRSNPKRRRFFWLVTLIAVLATLPLITHLKQNWPSIKAQDDRSVVASERIWRRAYFKMNETLPNTPDLKNLDERLANAGHKRGDPILMRVFKQEFELELWLRKDGAYRHFATYPICRFSGRLGPKLKEGDRQAPEGFYTVSKGQLNPNSRWHRSFNLGFPNLYDRSQNRTGSFLMVHGGCSSIGCYAMTNAVMDEIWALVTSALNKGQARFQVQAFPFRMTKENLAARSEGRWAKFWTDLKRGHDLFEETKNPPRVAVCNRRYTFAKSIKNSSSAPRIQNNCKFAPHLAKAAGDHS